MQHELFPWRSTSTLQQNLEFALTYVYVGDDKTDLRYLSTSNELILIVLVYGMHPGRKFLRFIKDLHNNFWTEELIKNMEYQIRLENRPIQ